jgi:CRP-like cAMP-binding protein
MRTSIIKESPNKGFKKTSTLVQDNENKYEDWEKFIESLQMVPINRTQENISYISHYLLKTELIEKINREKLSQQATVNLMQSCAKYAQYKSLNKGEILFQINDFADKFYIILRGTINVLKPVQKLVKIYLEDYIILLNKMRKNKELYLLQNTIQANKLNFPFESPEEIEKIELLLFKLKLAFLLSKNISMMEIEQVLKLYNIKFLIQLNIDILEMKRLLNKSREANHPDDHSHKKHKLRVFFMKDTLNATELNLNENLHQDDKAWVEYLKYRIILSPEEMTFKNSLKIFENVFTHESDFSLFVNEKFHQLIDGHYFGDYGLDNKEKLRTATIEADEECILASLPEKIYNEYISEEKNKVRLRDVRFLHNLFFFNNIKPSTFANTYFSYFVQQDLYRGHVLFKEKTKADRLYFIKEGSFELHYEGSIIELHQNIKLVIEKFLNLIDSSKFNIDLVPIIQNLKLKEMYVDENFDELTILKYNSTQYVDYVQRRKHYYLYLISEKEMLGIEDIFLLNELHNFKVVVKSEKAKLFYIDIHQLNHIFEKEKAIRFPYFKICNTRIQSYLKRLYELKQSSLELFSKKEKKDCEEYFRGREAYKPREDSLEPLTLRGHKDNKRKLNMMTLHSQTIYVDNGLQDANLSLYNNNSIYEPRKSQMLESANTRTSYFNTSSKIKSKYQTKRRFSQEPHSDIVHVTKQKHLMLKPASTNPEEEIIRINKEKIKNIHNSSTINNLSKNDTSIFSEFKSANKRLSLVMSSIFSGDHNNGNENYNLSSIEENITTKNLKKVSSMPSLKPINNNPGFLAENENNEKILPLIDPYINEENTFGNIQSIKFKINGNNKLRRQSQERQSSLLNNEQNLFINKNLKRFSIGKINICRAGIDKSEKRGSLPAIRKSLFEEIIQGSKIDDEEVFKNNLKKSQIKIKQEPKSYVKNESYRNKESSRAKIRE